MAVLSREDFKDRSSPERPTREVETPAGTIIVGMLSAAQRLRFATRAAASQSAGKVDPDLAIANTRQLLIDSMIGEDGTPIFRSDAEVRRWLESLYDDTADKLVTEIAAFNRLNQQDIEEATENFTETANGSLVSA